MNKKFFSVSEAAKIIGVSTNTVYKYLDDGSLKGKRLGGRGRFKIPYLELAPYLAQQSESQVVSNADVPESNTPEVSDVVQEQPTQTKAKPSFIGRWVDGIVVSLGAFFLIWGAVYVLTSSVPNLIGQVGGAVLNYSGRTFSGFGNIVNQVAPKENVTNQVASSIAPDPIKEDTLVVKEESGDVNSKTKDAERLIYDLYVNSQTLSSKSQVLLGKSKTLTVSELNESVGDMFDVLGLVSGQLTTLSENWNFPVTAQVTRSANQINTLLDDLKSQGSSVFVKPEIKDLNELVYQSELLQRLVGNTTDAPTSKTIFGNLKKVQLQMAQLDSKDLEINALLNDWDTYTPLEKQNSVKTLLSTTLDINSIPNIDDTIPTSLSGDLNDEQLHSIVLSIRELLSANKSYQAKKVGNNTNLVAKVLGETNINPIEIETSVAPAPTILPTPSFVAKATTTPLPSQKPTLLPTYKPTPKATLSPFIAAVFNTPTPLPTQSVKPMVLAATDNTFKSDTQKVIGLTISFSAITTLVIYLIALFINREKKPKQKITVAVPIVPIKIVPKFSHLWHA